MHLTVIGEYGHVLSQLKVSTFFCVKALAIGLCFERPCVRGSHCLGHLHATPAVASRLTTGFRRISVSVMLVTYVLDRT